jgi:hypothetical protein
VEDELLGSPALKAIPGFSHSIYVMAVVVWSGRAVEGDALYVSVYVYGKKRGQRERERQTKKRT